MHIVTSYIDFRYDRIDSAGMNASYQRSEVTARLMLITLAAGKCLRCLVFWAYSVDYSQVGALLTEAHIKVICQSPAGVKAIKPGHSCSQECICSEQMKETIVCNKHLWKAKDQCRLCSVFCLVSLWPLLFYGCRGFARLSWLLLSWRKWRARELHLLWITQGRLALAGGGVPNG